MCDIVLVGLIVGLTAFLWRVRKHRRRYAQNGEQRAQASEFFRQLDISAPNGLDPGRSTVPPTYQEALKAPPFKVVESGHHRHKSQSMIMDECMMAAYATEVGVNDENPRHHNITSAPNGAISPSAHSHDALMQPTSPRDVARGDMRQSVSRWLRNQRWVPGGSPGPLSSNPLQTPTTAGFPVPPSPSYTGVPPTPSASAPQTPMSASHLAPLYRYPEPPSARSTRSYMTGDDRLSIRASIPESVLYPSPLQPAPRSRRLTSGSRNRASVTSAQAYGSEAWTDMTPPEVDPPDYEPRRGS